MYIGSGIIFCIICTVFRVKCQLFSREAKFMCFRMCFPQHWAVICAGHVRVKVVTQRFSHLTCAALGCQKGFGKKTPSAIITTHALIFSSLSGLKLQVRRWSLWSAWESDAGPCWARHHSRGPETVLLRFQGKPSWVLSLTAWSQTLNRIWDFLK